MALLSAGFAAKGLFILMTCSSVATGLAHSKLIILTDQTLTRGAMFRHKFVYEWNKLLKQHKREFHTTYHFQTN